MTEQITILVIEDDKNINQLFMKKLTAAGYTCMAAFSVQEAIAILEASGPPSLIVLDLQLGDGLGTEVLDYLKANGHNKTKIIIVSANAFSNHIPMGGYSVDHTLLKPVSPRGLSALIKDILGR